MTLPTGDEQDARVLLRRLIERIDRTNDWFEQWMDYIHDRFERGATEMATLRAEIAELRGHRHQPPVAEQPSPKGWTAPIIALLKEAREFIEAIASLKEIALAIAIMMASSAVMSHPEAVTAIIASYNASGQKGHE